jgi:hypothetical protein
MTKGNLKNPLTGRARLLAVPSKSHKKAGFGPPGRLVSEDLLPHIARCFIPAPTPEKYSPAAEAVRSGILVVPFPGFFAVMNHTGCRPKRVHETLELDVRGLGYFLQRCREGVDGSINLRSSDDQRRLEADHVAVDPAHADQDPLAQ